MADPTRTTTIWLNPTWVKKVWPGVITSIPTFCCILWWVLVKIFRNRVGSFFWCSGWVYLIQKISPKNLNFFPFGSKKSYRIGSKNIRVKGESATYLLQVKSMFRSGWYRTHLKLRLILYNSIKIILNQVPLTTKPWQFMRRINKEGCI